MKLRFATRDTQPDNYMPLKRMAPTLRPYSRLEILTQQAIPHGAHLDYVVAGYQHDLHADHSNDYGPRLVVSQTRAKTCVHGFATDLI
ncbi:MAG: hypothetical protein ACR2OA_08070 [Rubripirellula sp.]